MIIVSNRLPISVKKVDGKLEFHSSVGGLAIGLASYIKSRKNMWIGWPGVNSEDLNDADKHEITTELKKRNCYPVFLTKKQVDEFYNGYSNEVLWPFFHSLPTPKEKMDQHWNAYKHVNLLFADVVMAVTKPDSTIWVHDYQLLLVPQMIRLSRPNDVIGFFLHIPFPPAKAFTKLPHAKSLTKGLLGSGLIGFHTQEYVQNFMDACDELKVGISSAGQVILANRAVQVGDFPLGIDYEMFAEANNSEIVRVNYQRLMKKFGKYKVILAFERLDPSKAFIQRLKAYREFLQQNPQFHSKVIMIMIAVPSRTDIPVYKKLKEDVEALVEAINKEFGRVGWKPVHYMYKIIPYEQVPAYYQIADIAFITPLRDGMNLMAKEYIASNANKSGVLILSETAGAAQQLTNALLVNPKKQASMVEGLNKAMTMTPGELQQRLNEMQKNIADNTVHKWKRQFVNSLQAANIVSGHKTHQLKAKYYQQLLDDFARSARPALVLDYDGVLVRFFDDPRDSKPTKPILSLLAKLSDMLGGDDLILISGRSRNDMQQWFGDLNITVAAEHGALLRPAGKPWQIESAFAGSWKQILLPTLQKYAAKTPGAFVEEKETALVWHYRKATPYHAQKNITILKRVLRPFLKAYGLVLNSGNMILELKAIGSPKGTAAKDWLYGTEDFILCIGDDYTDEDMFAVMPEHAYTVKVGSGKTLAKYRLSSNQDVIELLIQLTKLRQPKKTL